MSSPIFFFLFIPILTFILLAINFIFAPHNPYEQKNSAFECGFSSFLGQNRIQFHISFYIFALLFMIFDIELVIFYPYLVSAYFNSGYGLFIVLLFFLALTLGFAYEMGKKALSIDSRQTFNYAIHKPVYNEKFGMFKNISEKKYYSTYNFLGGNLLSNLYAYILSELEHKITNFFVFIIKSSPIYKLLKHMAYVLDEAVLSYENLIHLLYVCIYHILKICIISCLVLQLWGYDLINIFDLNKLPSITLEPLLYNLIYLHLSSYIFEFIYGFILKFYKNKKQKAYYIYNGLCQTLYTHMYTILLVYCACFLGMYFNDKIFTVLPLFITLGLVLYTIVFIYITFIKKDLRETNFILYCTYLSFIVILVIISMFIVYMIYNIAGPFFVFTGKG